MDRSFSYVFEMNLSSIVMETSYTASLFFTLTSGTRIEMSLDSVTYDSISDFNSRCTGSIYNKRFEFGCLPRNEKLQKLATKLGVPDVNNSLSNTDSNGVKIFDKVTHRFESNYDNESYTIETTTTTLDTTNFIFHFKCEDMS